MIMGSRTRTTGRTRMAEIRMPITGTTAIAMIVVEEVGRIGLECHTKDLPIRQDILVRRVHRTAISRSRVPLATIGRETPASRMATATRTRTRITATETITATTGAEDVQTGPVYPMKARRARPAIRVHQVHPVHLVHPTAATRSQALRVITSLAKVPRRATIAATVATAVTAQIGTTDKDRTTTATRTPAMPTMAASRRRAQPGAVQTRTETGAIA